MKNRLEIIKELMNALDCDYKNAEKQLDGFTFAICPCEPPKIENNLMIEVSKHDHGWYRKFEKQNKRGKFLIK